MLRMLRITTPGLLAALAVLVPATADAAKATFAVKIEAHRTVAWDHPRQVFAGDCNGDKYQFGNGSEDFKLKSVAGGRLVVEGTPKRLQSWEFGIEGAGRTLRASEDPDAKAVITRERTWITGRTGGWCGGAEQDPPQKGDCGTRLAPYKFRLSVYENKVGIRETLQSRTNEKFGFYQCDLPTPEKVPAGSLPSLEKKLPLGLLFSGRKEVKIEAEQDYGPARWSLGGGLFRTSTAHYKWTMTLNRVKQLKPRSENG